MSQPKQPKVVQKLLGSCQELRDLANEQGGESIYFGGDYEQLIIRRSELKQFAQKMADRSWSYQQRIKQLQGQIEQLTESSKKIYSQLSQQNKSLLQEKQKLTQLLNSKQEMLVNNQKHIQQLITTTQLKQLNLIQFNNINDSDHHNTRIIQLEMQKTQPKYAPVESKGAGLKRKIMVGVRKVDYKEKREVAQQTDSQLNSLNDLELAKLKLQICRLASQLHQLKTQNQLLQIQNSHLSQQNQLASSRERLLQTYLYQAYLPPHQSQFTHLPCSLKLVPDNPKTDDYSYKVDELAAKLQVDNSKIIPHPIAAPITPHFSCSAFGLFSKKTGSETLPFSCLSDQIFQSMSENQSSIRSEPFY